jgi:GTPase SAR1 family protein
MLVGLGDAGKTSLFNSLTGLRSAVKQELGKNRRGDLSPSNVDLTGAEEEGNTSSTGGKNGTATATEVTDGINIRDWVIELPDRSELTFSMWDFAGQSVYYNTHQFFLTSRAVYLIVWYLKSIFIYKKKV